MKRVDVRSNTAASNEASGRGAPPSTRLEKRSRHKSPNRSSSSSADEYTEMKTKTCLSSDSSEELHSECTDFSSRPSSIVRVATYAYAESLSDTDVEVDENFVVMPGKRTVSESSRNLSPNQTPYGPLPEETGRKDVRSTSVATFGNVCAGGRAPEKTFPSAMGAGRASQGMCGFYNSATAGSLGAKQLQTQERSERQMSASTIHTGTWPRGFQQQAQGTTRNETPESFASNYLVDKYKGNQGVFGSLQGSPLHPSTAAMQHKLPVKSCSTFTMVLHNRKESSSVE